MMGVVSKYPKKSLFHKEGLGMKKIFLVFGLVLGTLVFGNPLLESDEVVSLSSPGEITEEEVAQIDNPTIRDFARYFYESGVVPEEFLAWSDFVPRQGERFISIGEPVENEPPVIGVSPLGAEGVVASYDGRTYDTSDFSQSTTYSELKDLLTKLYEN